MRHNPSRAKKDARLEAELGRPLLGPSIPRRREDLRPTPWGIGILRGLQLINVYPGTADEAKVAARRAKNKARRTRRGAR